MADWELNSAQMGVGGGGGAYAARDGSVFSLSLDSLVGERSRDLALLNMAARLVDDLGRGDFSGSSCDRLKSDDFFSLGLSSARFASDRSDTELSDFLCRLFLVLVERLSLDLRGDDWLAL